MLNSILRNEKLFMVGYLPTIYSRLQSLSLAKIETYVYDKKARKK